MIKADIIKLITQRTNLKQKDVSTVVDEFLKTLSEALIKKERVEIRGFGVFKIKERKARVGRNPKTLEEVEIPGRDVPVFKPSVVLKRRILENK